MMEPDYLFKTTNMVTSCLVSTINLLSIHRLKDPKNARIQDMLTTSGTRYNSSRSSYRHIYFITHAVIADFVSVMFPAKWNLFRKYIYIQMFHVYKRLTMRKSSLFLPLVFFPNLQSRIFHKKIRSYAPYNIHEDIFRMIE